MSYLDDMIFYCLVGPDLGLGLEFDYFVFLGFFFKILSVAVIQDPNSMVMQMADASILINESYVQEVFKNVVLLKDVSPFQNPIFYPIFNKSDLNLFPLIQSNQIQFLKQILDRDIMENTRKELFFLMQENGEMLVFYSSQIFFDQICVYARYDSDVVINQAT